MIPSFINKIKNMATGAAKAIRMSSGMDAQGILSISLVYSDRTVKVMEKENLVVRGGKLRLLRALYQGDASSPIATLRVGNGGTIDPNGQFPKTVGNDQAGLFNQVESVGVSYNVNEERPYVTYIADIGPDLCNNLLISEAGLFFGDGEMFNIKTFPGIPKSLDFSIHFEWTIRIN